jgi:hypothetical protein
MSDRFTSDNTPDYDSDALRALNFAFQATCEDADLPASSDDIGLASMHDAMAETILAWYDEGRRGKDLIIPRGFISFP